MRTRTIVAVLAALLALPGLLFAQSAPAAATPPAISVTLAYHEDNSGTFDVRDGTGASVTMQDGDEMQLGWTVVTGKGDLAELKLNHTGTIIKIAQNTNFTLTELRSETGGQDVFSLAFGKIRTVAGKASGKNQYQIRTLSAVCGVRGSDIVVEFQEGAFDRLSTLEGTGWIQSSAGAAIDVGQGLVADALASSFAPVQIAPDVLNGLANEMKFTRLDVNETMAINKAYQESLATQPTETAPATPPAPKTSSRLDNFMSGLRNVLGFEIGSVTIGRDTWSKIVVEPTFQAGKLKAALYLPIIYQDDMFNSSDYYRPAGNNEWSFGSDQHNTSAAVQDFAVDLLLKIKYIEWGQQGDPIFFKVGNLEDITIGHGLIMRDFANDADFPSIRRIGVNVGLDFGGFGFQAMVNDLTDPEVFGGRTYIRPIPGFKMALGFSTIVDFNPARDFLDVTNGGVVGPVPAGSPIFIYPGLDLDLPFVEGDAFGLVAFADGGLLLPYFRSAPSPFLGGSVINPGFAFNAIYNKSASMPFKNWGIATGLLGNLVIRDLTWRVEFRDYTGSFTPQFYSSGYERQRSLLVYNVLGSLIDPNNPLYNTQNMGIYGEGGIALDRLFSLKLSYFWPWQKDSSGNFTFAGDDFMVKFILRKGFIPAVNLWGSIAYERTDFVNSIQHGVNLFDANTVVSTSITYSVTESLDVTLLYTTTAQRDSSGNLIYASPTDPLPRLDTSLTIEMQVHL
jgi:FecR protein